jgi:hypothetical protein
MKLLKKRVINGDIIILEEIQYNIIKKGRDDLMKVMDLNLRKEDLLSLGEVMDRIQIGKLAFSIIDGDIGFEIIVNPKDDYLMVKSPDEEFFRYENYFRVTNTKEKRWIIIDMPENYLEFAVEEN